MEWTFLYNACMKYLKHYWVQVLHWWTLPKKIDWVDDFWAPLGAVLAVCVVMVAWVFMLILGPFWEIVSWPWQMRKLEQTKKESIETLLKETDLHSVTRYRTTLEDRKKDAEDKNRMFEVEQITEVIEVAERREVELQLGMVERGEEAAEAAQEA